MSDEKIIHKHLLLMLKTRQWLIDEQTPGNFPQKNTLFGGTTDTRKKFACLQFNSFGVKPTKMIAQICHSTGTKHLVLVLNKIARAPSQTWLRQQGIEFEIFLPHELMYNPLHHPLQPKFIRLTAKQKNAFLSHYGLDSSCLPKFVRKDMMVRYHLWPPGTLIKVVFPSSISHRLVQ